MELTNAVGEKLTVERHGWTVWISSQKPASGDEEPLELHHHFVTLGFVVRALLAKPGRKVKL